MFSRRKNSRVAAHAANAPPTSSAASTAAMQAFLASRASSSNLSSAAAAAALRSHTTSPTNPAAVQTKRMQRRLSTSSNGSAASRPTLQRAGSNGSMTERTFRESSPLRSVSPSVEHPPIPPIPKTIPKKTKVSLAARPSSAEPPGRVSSPQTKAPAGRGVSLDRGRVDISNETIPPMPKSRPPRIDTKAAVDPAKRMSVNFSRPMSPAPASPSASSMTNINRAGKPDPKVLTSSDVNNIEYNLEDEATRLVKKKKKRVAQEVVEGSHLAAGRLTGRPSGTAVKSMTPQQKVTKLAQSPVESGSDLDSPLPSEAQSPTSRPTRPVDKLVKKPSVVKEDAEGEAEAEKGIETPFKPANGKPRDTPNGKTSLTPSATPSSASQILKPSPGTDLSQRRASLSPSRTARFSSQPVHDMSGGIKHEPPPRAISPAKSALKHSPSRGQSPALLNHDIPDNVSVASDEGRKKKKSVRVSFEDNPAVATATNSSSERSPLVSARGPRRDLESPEPDDKISPIPTLPSFGSIRGRRDKLQDEPKALYGDEQARKNLADMTSSSDHAVGAVIAHAAMERASKDPKPPQVTSVEGSGNNSDEDSEDEVDVPTRANDFPDLVPNNDGEDATSSDVVPVIAVQPATPALDAEKQSRDSWLANMPGEFQESPNKSSLESSQTDELPSQSTNEDIPRRESIVEPEPESAQREHDPESPTIGSIADSLRRQEDETKSDSGDSVYSDAAEDPVDPEGDGFGSINAIVDTPVGSPITSPVSYSKRKDEDQDESPKPTSQKKTKGEWDTVQNYWSEVHQSTKTQLDPEAVGIAISEPATVNEAVPIVKQPTRPTKSSKSTTKPLATKVMDGSTTKSQAPAPRKPALKKTVRTTTDQSVTQARDSIPAFKKTMRGPQSMSNVSLPATRPTRKREDSDASLPSVIARRSPLPAVGSVTTAKKRSLRDPQPPLVNGTADKPSLTNQTMRSAPSKLNRTMSNDSDSESSFTKERRKRPVREGGFARKSMRGPPAQSQTPATSSSAPTPAIRNRPMSMTGVSLRTSMRDQPPIPKRPSSLRVASPSGSFFSRRKGVEEKRPLTTRKFSDDSFNDRPTAFRSKYADSSDEEEIADLAPVRGIPRRTDEEDSTDLEDSDQEPKTKIGSKPAAAATAPISSSALAAKSMRTPATPAVTNLTLPNPAEKKKRSFFGILGRKKDNSKVGKSDIESAARRDTPLERTKLERNEISNRASTPEPPTPLETPVASPPQSPSIRPAKLRRRSTYESQRIPSSQWPLPPSPPPDLPTPVRPTTSDGTPARPTVGSRQVSNATYSADGAVLGRSGKKKRFPMLRKAFGLHD